MRNLITLALFAVLLSGCVRVYKIDIQQGNDLSEKQLEGITVGMSRQEIKSLLGTPLVEDPFHTDRWDYFYTFKSGRDKEMERRQLILIFSDGVLARVEGSTGKENVQASLTDLEELDEAMVGEEANDDKSGGFWQRLKNRNKPQSEE